MSMEASVGILSIAAIIRILHYLNNTLRKSDELKELNKKVEEKVMGTTSNIKKYVNDNQLKKMIELSESDDPESLLKARIYFEEKNELEKAFDLFKLAGSKGHIRAQNAAVKIKMRMDMFKQKNILN